MLTAPSISAIGKPQPTDTSAPNPITEYWKQDSILLRSTMLLSSDLVALKYASNGKLGTFVPVSVKLIGRQPFLIGSLSDDPTKPKPAIASVNSLCGDNLELFRWEVGEDGRPVGMPAEIEVANPVEDESELKGSIVGKVPTDPEDGKLFVVKVPAAFPLAGQHTSLRNGALNKKEIMDPVADHHPTGRFWLLVAGYQTMHEGNVFAPNVPETISGVSPKCVPVHDRNRPVVNAYDGLDLRPLDEDDDDDKEHYAEVLAAMHRIALEIDPNYADASRGKDDDSIPSHISTNKRKRKEDDVTLTDTVTGVKANVAATTTTWQLLGAKRVKNPTTGVVTIELGTISQRLRDVIDSGENSSTQAANMNRLAKDTARSTATSENFLFRGAYWVPQSEYAWRTTMRNRTFQSILPHDHREPNYDGELTKLSSVLAWFPANAADTDEIKSEILMREAEVDVERAEQNRTNARTKISIKASFNPTRYSIIRLLANLCNRDLIFLDMDIEDDTTWSLRFTIYYKLAKIITSPEFVEWHEQVKTSIPFVGDSLLVLVHNIEKSFNEIAGNSTVRRASIEGTAIKSDHFDPPCVAYAEFVNGLKTCYSTSAGGQTFAAAPAFSKWSKEKKQETTKTKHQEQEIGKLKSELQSVRNENKEAINRLIQQQQQQQRQMQYGQQQYGSFGGYANVPPPPPGTPGNGGGGANGGRFQHRGGSPSNTNGLVETNGQLFSPPRMSVMLCRDHTLKGRSCTRDRCNFRHINAFSDLSTNDQRILHDYVSMHTEISWVGAAPTRPNGPIEQI